MFEQISSKMRKDETDYRQTRFSLSDMQFVFNRLFYYFLQTRSYYLLSFMSLTTRWQCAQFRLGF